MREILLNGMRERGGVISRCDALLLLRVGAHVVDKAVRAGAIVRPFPQVYLLAELKDNVEAMDLAALAYVRRGALSHTSGLRVWRLPHTALSSDRHLTTTPNDVARHPGLKIHRRRGFSVGAPDTVVRDERRVVRLERAIVESWPYLAPDDRRMPAIAAVNSRMTTGARLTEALDEAGNLPGTAEMRRTFSLLALGCRSELELWGHARVFDYPGLPPAVLQHPIHTRAGTFVLDRAHLTEKVGVELDGAAWHGSPAQRERDVRRDAALAANGWLIVRFTHARLCFDPDGCRRDLAEILSSRRTPLQSARLGG